jgi:AraC-like DNA-binding protein
MQLIHFLPQNELIRKHVECFHITNYEEKNLDHQVQIYPHYFNAVSIFAKASCLFNDDGFNVKEDANEKLKIVLLGGFTRPILAKVSGRIKSLSIVFKPTGLNYFTIHPFNEWNSNPKKNNFPFWTEKYDELSDLLNGHDFAEIISKLEAILLAFYRPFENRLLFQILDLLHSSYTDNNVEELAQNLGVSRKTLLRQFKKHLGVNITDYRRIMRFREAIKLHNGSDEALTTLAYKTYFSDQSHFIKDIHKLTGDNPKKFFKEAGYVNDTPFFLKIS